MRVAMVDPSLFTGRYDDSLCAALAGEGHDVILFGRRMRATDAVKPQSYAYSARFFGLSERLRAFTGEGRAFRAVKAAEYSLDCMIGPLGRIASVDAVHVQWLPFAAADRHMLSRLQGRAALIHTVHNATPYHGDGKMAAMQGRGYRALLDQFDALIAHGEPTRDALIRQSIDPALIHVVPHPPMRLAQADAAMLDTVPDPVLPRILFFGTIRPYKGFDLLIDACIALWNAGHRFELAVAGKPFMDIGPLLDAVEQAGRKNDLVLDLGFLKEERLDAHLRKADIIAFPYRHIDSSGAFLSALHYGKAMVASNAGMFRGLPADADGEQAVSLVEAGNAHALADALLPLITSGAVRQQAGMRAKGLASRLGDWEDVAVRTAKVYEAAIRRKSER
ncbi:glycosyltransferase family 4 protein [Sphingobium phenoxybenzoativorans]|uniref:Glycosyltransferase family 4 protein n=1 Tax=Sphingobium phenoxybenzoativorans TaxID=1592790 RepID=A0A975K3S1_9SPHN|nr:glycosyltransferase family 4 protein [Sphingobium phenoxybenzoativorans]QUT04336.1 glycosyltransferase family 4 protein [Sphingobium phenoxybenzoativorans]